MDFRSGISKRRACSRRPAATAAGRLSKRSTRDIYYVFAAHGDREMGELRSRCFAPAAGCRSGIGDLAFLRLSDRFGMEALNRELGLGSAFRRDAAITRWNARRRGCGRVPRA